MAAGSSSRYGRNKLLEMYGGQSLAERALDAVPVDMLERVVVVTGYQEVRASAEMRGFEIVINDRPDDGLSLTIRLGLESLRDMDAVLFLVCDQPFLTNASVASVVKFYRENPNRIVSLACRGKRGNPCIFPSRFFPELIALDRDAGGSAVIRMHEASLLLYETADASELRDVDHESDFDDIRGSCGIRKE